MKKAKILLILFWIAMAVAAWYVIKTIRKTNEVIKEGETPVV